MQINWDSFQIHNQDSKGIRQKFEDLSRQLFINENLLGNKRYRYLHANPNNAGLETEPIFDEVNQRWVGFQAKYFDGDVDYSQIKHSAQKTIEHYTGQDGIVELVYLFCNQPIKSTAKGYVDTVSILRAAGIEMQLVTENAILDLVRNKYPYLGLYYFGSQSINSEWFASHTDEMFAELGERYNKDFNVESEFTDEMSLFVRDGRAAYYLNQKKEKLYRRIEKEKYRHFEYLPYLISLAEEVAGLKDVDEHTLSDAYEWREKVLTSITSQIEELEKKKQVIKEKIEAQSADSQQNRTKEIRVLYSEINEIDNLVSMADQLTVTEREHELLEKRVLFIKGEAGIGKSQLLAWETKELLDEGKAVLLLIAGIYFTDDPIANQIMNNLHLRYSIDELIDILETIGEKENRIVPVFVDALNETWNKHLWKTGFLSIIRKINESPMVKLVVTYRTEYEKYVLPDMVLEHKEQYITMYHTGFRENSLFATKEFLHHYNIPFSPIAHFSNEMTNPLFLTMYCKTYNGEEVSLPALFERVLLQANRNIYKAFQETFIKKGYNEDDNILGELINEISTHLIVKERKYITKRELAQLSFWQDYGIDPAPYINQLTKEKILYNWPYQEEESYYFSYDQMNDYYCAKAIVKQCGSKEEVREYLTKSVLGIVDQTIEKSWNTGLFIHTCAMYAEKYNEECIEIIDVIPDCYEKTQIVNSYFSSFQWRNAQTICKDTFMELLNKYACDSDVFWPMVIGNSMKVAHPLNAIFLHNLLINYDLNKRDYLWTLYINKISLDKTDRLVQLIEMYNKGEELEVTSEKQIELLLILLCWVLTSSNRWIRDNASKAMIEILKSHFSLCIPLLERFKEVNDPYVISRLYGVIFGASCKRSTEESIQTLAEYVYENVFNQEVVYPDILLRDYARLIIERFLFEEPNYSGTINREKIIPPYYSDPIPEIEDQQYLQQRWNGGNGGLLRIIHSMCFEGMGMYGDFGRYVFQTALHHFDIDEQKIFNYAIYYIMHELGYTEEYFGEYDKHCVSYDRHDTIKVERIGKKYQWIIMYNILARVADHYKMIDRWNYSQKDIVCFEGPWNPYVRDFDPTLNQYAMKCENAPKFVDVEDLVNAEKAENDNLDLSTEENKNNWLEHKGPLFSELNKRLIKKDENGTDWVLLTTYIDARKKDMDIVKKQVWSSLYAFFITPNQEKEMISFSENGHSLISYELAHPHETYTVLNREYPWAPSCAEFEKDAWVEINVKTGEFEEGPVADSDLSTYRILISQYGIQDGEEDESNDDSIHLDDILGEEDTGESIAADGDLTEAKAEYGINRQEKEISIGKILHATTDILWEEEFDASKEETISYSVPCGELIKEMQLIQMREDGFYYDCNRQLAAYDANLVQGIKSVIIRKDILDGYLEKTGLKLVWLIEAGKEIFDECITARSEWEALFIYNGNDIDGELHRIATL